MTKQLYLFASLLALIPYSVNAQMLSAKPAAVEPPEAVLPSKQEATPQNSAQTQKITAEDILKQNEKSSATITAEEKARAKENLIEGIMVNIDNASVKERKDILNMMNALQKVSTRRKNLNLPDGQKFDEDAELDINPNSTRDVQKYLIEKFTEPLDRAIPEPLPYTAPLEE